MDVAVVVPSIRPESLATFLTAWASEFERYAHCLLLTVFETHGDEQSQARWREMLPGSIELLHLTQRDVEERFGADSWIVPTTNSSCRCFGMLEAYRAGAEVTISLDDDATPDQDDVIGGHHLTLQRQATLDWWPIAQTDAGETLETRGFPYRIRARAPIKLHQGLWTGMPDIDAMTQLTRPGVQCARVPRAAVVPRWNYFPMSWMNVSIHRDLMPALCPPPSIMHKPTDRFDDTWTGVCLKRVMDHLGWAASYGPPYVHHERATDPETNLKIEESGLILQEEFWRDIRACPLDGTEVPMLSAQIAEFLANHPESAYIRKVGESRALWNKAWAYAANGT